ncbi:MAG: nucleotidyltransferase substrate binding protein [Bacteroidia bacterium]
MLNQKDIRWIQRFSKYKKALSQLEKFIDKGTLNELEQQGLIQAFEYTFELAWNTIKDFYEYQGEEGIQGSRDAFRMAFRRELIANGDAWMEMIKSRQLTVHSYNEETANEIAEQVQDSYIHEFMKLRSSFEEIIKKQIRKENKEQ